MHDYIVNTSEGISFEFDDDDVKALDLIKNDDGTYHVLHNNRSYNIIIIKRDLNLKKLLLAVNGREFELSIKDKLDQKLDKLGFTDKKKGGTGEIKSPMPGLVHTIDLTEGQSLDKGDTLLILEAMKMENIIRAENPLTIKSICVKKGDTVAKNQVLLVVE
jgi:biotin carboxyl carrier protein